VTIAWWLVPLGAVVGMIGTLIGAGGGFLLVPILLLAFPGEAPELITSVSLAVVVVNASAGTLSYARLKRIDYRSGLMFAAATLPGAVLGALATERVDRYTFDVAFGALLLVTAALLWWRPLPPPDAYTAEPREGRLRRRLVDRAGTEHVWHYPLPVGLAASAVVGFVSSLMGIGGGIIHVPVLAQLLDFPVHIATATSQFTLAIMALAGTLVHVATGTLGGPALERTALLAFGVMLGAPLGAVLSSVVPARRIMQVLAVALGLVGLRVLVGALS
jgi:uncharacterized membrane protein YfcA